MDEELFALFLEYLPESVEGWIGFAIVTCAILGALWPKPAPTAHPVLRGLHALVNAIGLNVRHAKNINARQKKVGAQEKAKVPGQYTGMFGRFMKRQ